MAPGIALPVPDAAGRARAGSGAGANVEAATLLGSRRDAQVGGAREEDPAWAEVAKLAVRASSSTGVWAIGRRTSGTQLLTFSASFVITICYCANSPSAHAS
jgi:hypothetical protein